MSGEDKFIISVDIGTTTIRSCLYDQKSTLKFNNERPITLICDSQDDGSLRSEMDPERLFSDFKELVSESISKLPDISQLAGLSICCQRNTIVSWNRRTLIPYHNLMTWKDLRAIEDCRRWNNSFLIKMLNLAGKVAYFFTRSERFKAASFYSFVNAMVIHRFLSAVSKDIDMQQALDENQLQFATLDTYLISRLTLGKACFTEPSNASSTGLFDPFLFDWGFTILKLIGFPLKTLPEIKYSAGEELCRIDKSIFGVEIPLLSLLGDSQAGIIGAGCLNEGMVKISLGTGTFFNIVSSRPYASMNGVYPLVGWSLPDKRSYTIESRANDTATPINWALSMSLCDKIEDTSNYTNEDAQPGLCFIPSFSGTQTPIEDNNACAGFLGLRPHTTKKQMMFAVIESVAFKIKQIWDIFGTQDLLPEKPIIRLCGGVSKNDFICQQIANLIGRAVETTEPDFCSARGVALLGWVSAGVWKFEDIANSAKINKRFEPQQEFDMSRYKQWRKATERCLNFY